MTTPPDDKNDPLDPWNEACQRWVEKSATDPESFLRASADPNGLAEKEMVDNCLNGFMSTMSLLAGVELGLFAALTDGPLDLPSLSKKLNVPPANVWRIVLILQKCGLLTLDGRGIAGGITVTPAALRYFVPSTPGFDPYVWPRLDPTRLFFDKYSGSAFLDVARGKQFFDEFHYPPKDEAESRTLEHIMATEAPHFAALAWRALKGLPQVKRLLDVGGGDGTIACALAHNFPELEIAVLNLPSAVPLIEKTTANFGTTSRVKAHPADFLKDEFPKGFDAVLFSRVLIDWPDDVVASLLTKARAALAPGGKLIITERLRPNKPSMTGVSRMWLTFMAIGIQAYAFARSRDQWAVLCAKTGFSPPQIEGGEMKSSGPAIDDNFDEGYGTVQATAV